MLRHKGTAGAEGGAGTAGAVEMPPPQAQQIWSGVTSNHLHVIRERRDSKAPRIQSRDAREQDGL